MAQVFPDSEIQLYRNVPLNVNYNHTIYFPSRTEQNTYFTSTILPVYTLNPHSYQRVSSGKIRVNLPYKYCCTINYMRFKNSGYYLNASSSENPYQINTQTSAQKWYYAFVLYAEYINDEVTELYYVIDSMQTYFLDVVLLPCFVEREHSATDLIGENLLPEPVNTGEYTMTEVKGSQNPLVEPTPEAGFNAFYGETSIFVLASWDIFNDDSEFPYEPTGSMINGLYSGLTVYDCRDGWYPPWTPTSAPGCQNKEDKVNFIIKTLTRRNKENNIVAIYTAPSSFAANRTEAYYTQYIDKDYTWEYRVNGTNATRRPHNNKLYTAPYTLLHALSPNGDTHDYFYEYFSSQTYCSFRLNGVASGAPEMQFVPLSYKGVAKNLNERMIMGDYPMNSWAIDAYRAWLAQNRGRLAIQAAGDIATLGFGLGRTMLGAEAVGSDIAGQMMHFAGETAYGYAERTSGGYIDRSYHRNRLNPQINMFNKYADMTGSFLDKVDLGSSPADKLNYAASGVDYALNTASLLNEIAVASTRGANAKGSQNTSIDIALDQKYIHLYHTRVNDYYANIIDDYFDRYGYSTKRLKVPNIHVRKYWTYVKTVGCEVDATTDGVPQSERDIIEAIFNKGITFWDATTGHTIGNYHTSDGNPILSATQGGE